MSPYLRRNKNCINELGWSPLEEKIRTGKSKQIISPPPTYPSTPCLPASGARASGRPATVLLTSVSLPVCLSCLSIESTSSSVRSQPAFSTPCFVSRSRLFRPADQLTSCHSHEATFSRPRTYYLVGLFLPILRYKSGRLDFSSFARLAPTGEHPT